MQTGRGAEPISGRAFAALFAGFALLYLLAMPGNHIESVDRHAYAMWAETLPLSNLIDTRSILFTVINRSLFLASQALGLNLPATTLIAAYSILAGAGACVLQARILNRHFSLPPLPAVIGGVLLGLSYGVWRFAMEVEVYVASIFLVLVALSFLLDRLSAPLLKPARFILPGVVSGLVVMFYQPNVFPLFLAVPVLFLASYRFVPFLAYGAAGTLTVTATYVAAFLLARDEPFGIQPFLAFIGSRNAEFVADPANLTSLAKMALAISHTLLSSNWVFGVDRLTEAFQARFPATETEMKVLAASHFRPWVYVPFVLIPVLATVGTALLVASRRGRQRPDWRLIWYYAGWLVIYGLVAGRLDPGIAEVWITTVPIWVVFGTVLVLAPAFRAGAGAIVFAFVACVALWNWFGGVGMLKNPEGDFFARQTAGLPATLSETDLIVLTDATWKARTYLQHVLPARILAIDPACTAGITGEAEILRQVREKTAGGGGHVYVFHGFVNPSPRLAHVAACPALRDNAVALARSLTAKIRHVGGEGAFSVYEIQP